MGSSSSVSSAQSDVDRIQKSIESSKAQLARWQDAVKRARANGDKSGAAQAQSAVAACKQSIANDKIRLVDAKARLRDAKKK